MAKAKPSKKIRDMLAAHDNKPEEGVGPIMKLYFLPRNAKQVLEVEVQEGRKNITTRPIGPNFGKEGCKYLAYCHSVVTPDFWCVPYDSGRVLRFDVQKEVVEEVGEEIRPDDQWKYVAAAGSLNWQGMIYAAPCRAMRVLEIDPQLGVSREVGNRIGSEAHAKYMCYAVCPGNLKIYAIPYDARYVLEIDPVRNGAAKEVGPDLGKVMGKSFSMEWAVFFLKLRRLHLPFLRQLVALTFRWEVLPSAALES